MYTMPGPSTIDAFLRGTSSSLPFRDKLRSAGEGAGWEEVQGIPEDQLMTTRAGKRPSFVGYGNVSLGRRRLPINGFQFSEGR